MEETRQDAFEANESQEDAMARIMETLMKNQGKPQSLRRYLLRIVEEDPNCMGNMGMCPKGLDFMHNDMRRHAQTPEKNSSKVHLHQVLEKPQYKGKPFEYEYEYDFGDCWCHEITALGREPATDFFLCKDGEGHYVAEDVGGTKGWENLKAAYRASRPDKEQRDKMIWFEQVTSNADPHGLRNGRERSWAKTSINGRLTELAVRTFSFT